MSEPVRHPRCIYMCCKSMMVMGESFADDPEYQAGLTDAWCMQTSKSQGPDGEFVSLELCSAPDRECYKAY